ncbi:MAG: GNAT family N-acetyltransferase [Gammaproteobacteria bacterium]|nr:GNAT family N-acetyltransferase [Gammaproteobacteria bacterium]
MEIKIEPLARPHNRHDFDCGIEELNMFLRKYSFQNKKSHISKTFVAVDDEQTALTKKDVLGFYTLSAGQINFEALPKAVKHPRYPVSIARLARLAVDLKHQGKGVGGFLLYDALQKIKTVSQTIGVFAVVVDAKDVKAKSFYEKYGFVSLQETDLTLCLPMKVLDKL